MLLILLYLDPSSLALIDVVARALYSRGVPLAISPIFTQLNKSIAITLKLKRSSSSLLVIRSLEKRDEGNVKRAIP